MKEILKELVASITLPEDQYLQQDAEILAIFVEEIDEIFQALNQLFQAWQVELDYPEIVCEVRRHFHTLKGSGRMIGAFQAGELAWTVEDILNQVIAKKIRLSTSLQIYIKYVFRFYQARLYPCFETAIALQDDVRPLILLGQQLQQDELLNPELMALLVDDPLPLDTDQTIGAMTAEETWAVHDLAETIQVFIEEAEEHLTTIERFLIDPTTNCPEEYNALIRALHTLRGSSSMAQIAAIFTSSAKVEKLFKSFLLQEDVVSTSAEMTLLTQYAYFIRQYLPALQTNDEVRCVELTAEFEVAWEVYGRLVPMNEQDNPHGIVTQLLRLDIDLLLDTELNFIERAKINFPVYLKRLTEQAERLSLHTDNRAAVGIHQYALALKSAYIKLWSKPELLNLRYAEQLFDQAHLEFIHLFDTLASGQRVVLSPPAQTALQQLHRFIDHEVEQLIELNQLPLVVRERGVVVDFTVLSQCLLQDRKLRESEQSQHDFDFDLLDIFLEEAEELLDEIDQNLVLWAKDQDSTALKNLMRYLHTLKGGANMVQARHIGLIAHELESIYERIIQQHLQVTPVMIQIIQLVQDNVSERIDLIRKDQVDYPAPQMIDLLQHIEQVSMGGSRTETPYFNTVLADERERKYLDTQVIVPALERDVQQTAAPQSLQRMGQEIDTCVDEYTLSISSHSLNKAALTTGNDAELSIEEIIEQSFYEEAEEILERARSLLQMWFEQRHDRSILLQLQRTAHSLKGGARMANIQPIADVAYKVETLFEQFAVHKISSNVHDGLLESTLEWLKRAIFVRDYRNVEYLIQCLSNIEYVNTTVHLPSEVTQVDFFTPPKEMEWVQGDGSEPPSMYGEWGISQSHEHHHEMIRISADLVEKMIDLSGENAINCSRVGMDLGQLGNVLNEMDLTIHRLSDQLRRMDGELETQILAKHDQAEYSLYQDFDPLEMDQYSSLNQLSKSLSESVSDLVDFKVTLSEKIRDTESLLLQQSRIQSEIQESLMRTRLVPFSSMLPRLQRIVRQTSSVLNRPTELIVQNSEGELDRTILERLITPFEHMLRNAIDHGIEDTAQRRQFDKPKMGRIELNISRQGTDIVVTFKDDGKGIDPVQIRAKAERLGLIQSNQSLDEQDLIQLIFHPGFSTAEQITQISGRGVGLDIVQSEIRELGGHVVVTSIFGQGTTFSICVPTTVAVSDALMVKVGDQQFALPLVQIDRILRIRPDALTAYFNGTDDDFEIDQVKYKLRYLSEFVGNQNTPRLNNTHSALPVLLIKGSGGQSVALLVDQLIGSRSKIVVKSIGPQFCKVASIAGATILGDGEVCLILDGQHIARLIQNSVRHKDRSIKPFIQALDQKRRRILIVDDSVTVRKVTTRLLERHGFEVTTANDGVVAMEQLETSRPDLMLLDIEMPRMDGFEVTSLIRRHEIYQHLPIVMITSRTGEKHRERAFSLGVNHYMGKPFQEAELLTQIQQILLN